MNGQNDTGHDHLATPRETPYPVNPQIVLQGLLKELTKRAIALDLKKIDLFSVHISMTAAQRIRYMSAILKLMASRGLDALTPSVLFDAADIAIAGESSLTEARIGLLPGTMNPIHHGHLSTALAAVLAYDLNGVLLALGGAPSDKPYSVDFALRNEMLAMATREPHIEGWIHGTSIRQEVVEMFSGDESALRGTSDDNTSRRSTMDFAAFIWLFRSNPHVKWTYLVGSDKIADYGRKSERSLVIDVLGDARANVQVVYCPRLGKDIDVRSDIAPYPWLFEKWKSGFFKTAPISACDISASKIRRALVEKQNHINGIPLANCLSQQVLSYILNNEALLSSYLRELAERRSGFADRA
jgi:nicotinic acid mononucleotide adenylyltransferase